MQFQEECIDVLRVVKARINSQHEDISSHLLLSIFKIAEVDVVYPTPPSSAISDHRPNGAFIIIITIIITLYNINKTLSLILLVVSLLESIVNFITNLFDKFRLKHRLDLGSNNFNKTLIPSDAYYIREDENYFLKNKLDDYINILMKYNEFIESNIKMIIVLYYARSHSALALDSNAQKQCNTNNLNTVVFIKLYINKFNKIIHIIKAVSITIFIKFNKLVADVIIISKYFSRDVYYYIICTIVKEKLFGKYDFEKIASSSYGIVQSVSLGLNLEVV